MKRIQSIEILEAKTGFRFRNKLLIKQALTHSSYANELRINKLEDYERLEFLGDAVLELVSSEFLFREYASLPEGEMTKLRSSFVCEPALAYCAREIGLGECILLGRGEEVTGGRNRDSILSDVMEAIIGAVYLDGGFEEAGKFIHRFILSDVEKKQLFYDSKTVLQERVQSEGKGVLSYQVVGEEGPDHDKIFRVELRMDQKVIGEGEGRTKKAAEQQAAYQALRSERYHR